MHKIKNKNLEDVMFKVSGKIVTEEEYSRKCEELGQMAKEHVSITRTSLYAIENRTLENVFDLSEDLVEGLRRVLYDDYKYSIKLQADISNGVYLVEDFEDSVTKLEESSFLSSLKYCRPNEILATEAKCKKILNAILHQYGIRGMATE
jgi:hypothetical protein